VSSAATQDAKGKRKGGATSLMVHQGGGKRKKTRSRRRARRGTACWALPKGRTEARAFLGHCLDRRKDDDLAIAELRESKKKDDHVLTGEKKKEKRPFFGLVKEKEKVSPKERWERKGTFPC